MRDARRGRFDAVLVWASDRIARSVKHFLEVLDELNRLNIGTPKAAQILGYFPPVQQPSTRRPN
jgi:DNA invertase Pin-like site-specific DNA recombinase